MKSVYLASISGTFNNWRYFQVIIKVSTLVENIGTVQSVNYRVKTVNEVKEIYAENINEMLQRNLDESRVQPLVNYLKNQQDAYVNNLTVAIFDGNPEVFGLDIRDSSIINHHGEEVLENLDNSFCILKLTGNETLFVLDGQHRLLGLRKAVLENPQILDQEVALTLIIHWPNEKGRKRTRRLFTTINRYAKPVSEGESILLDEDDASAIIVRHLLQNYLLFNNDVIALHKNVNLNPKSDNEKFSTAVALYRVNETLINNEKIYPKYDGPKKNLVRVRPEEKILSELILKVEEFWNYYFGLFNESKDFVDRAIEHRDAKRADGGFFSLRPIFQICFSKIYKEFQNDAQRLKQLSRIKDFPKDLTHPFWAYILWRPGAGKILQNKSRLENYLKYHLDLPLSESKLSKLEEDFKKESDNQMSSLPKRYIQSQS